MAFGIKLPLSPDGDPGKEFCRKVNPQNRKIVT